MEEITQNSLWINSRKFIDIEESLLYANKGCEMRGFSRKSTESSVFSTVFLFVHNLDF
jgi:hypothetical protein